MPKTRNNGLMKVTVMLRADQYEYIHTLALENSFGVGGKPDSSSIIRGLIDLYTTSQKTKQKGKKK